MKIVLVLIVAFALGVWWMLLGEPQHTDTLLAHFPVDDASELSHDIHRVDAAMDYDSSSDGNGSLRIDASGPTTFVELAKVHGNGEDLSFRQLVYQARVRTQDAVGPVFLVMQAGVTGAPEGSMPVVGREGAITGTHDWTTLEVHAGNGAGVRHLTTTLQLEIHGGGTVWVDDLRLLSRQIH
jgi:hypothetical protein